MKSKSGKKIRKVTLEDLAQGMARSFALSEKNHQALVKSHEDLARKTAEGFALSKKNYDDLARMTAEGFADISVRMATKEDLEKVRQELKQEIQGLRSSVNNYLRLSDERYLELKNNQKVLAKYLHVIFRERKPQASLKDLEAILK